MEETPENGKESSHSAHANGMNEMNELATMCIKHILTETSAHIDNRKKRKNTPFQMNFKKKNYICNKISHKKFPKLNSYLLEGNQNVNVHSINI